MIFSRSAQVVLVAAVLAFSLLAPRKFLQAFHRWRRLAGSPGPPVCRQITHRISMLLSLLIRAMVTAFYMALPMCGKLRTRVTCGPPSPHRGLADLTVAEIM